jgi:hypothetical protein
VSELVKLVGLPGSEDKYPAQLSGGQQQRIALARALATSPGLLLLDEPLSALDAIVRVHLRSEIRSLQRKLGVTTIMVTHDQEEALSVADRIVVMNHGRIEQVGTPMQVYREPASPSWPTSWAASTCCRPRPKPVAGCAWVRPRSTVRTTRHRAAPSRSTCGPRTCWPGRSSRATATCSTPDREDRVPGLVLPGARGQPGAGRAAADGLPVAELPGRAAAGRAAACRCACCPSACACSYEPPDAPAAPQGAPPMARRSRFHGGSLDTPQPGG